ncbi:unconventional myosin-XVI-like, partial [Lampetra fluviatilis]
GAGGGAGGGAGAPRTGRSAGGRRTVARAAFGRLEMLHDAILQHDDKEVLKLLKVSFNPNAKNLNGNSLLHTSARSNNVLAAELLLERGADVNAQDDDSWTPLHAAAACDHADVLLLLLLAGANVLLQDVDGNVALDYTHEGTQCRHLLLRHLEENGVDVGALRQLRNQRPLSMLADVTKLVASGSCVNLPNEEGVTLVSDASSAHTDTRPLSTRTHTNTRRVSPYKHTSNTYTRQRSPV